MNKLCHSAKWFMLLSGIPIVIFGITMLFTPLKNLVVLAFFIGIPMLISGISQLVIYYSAERSLRSDWMLAGGILTALFGIWTVFGCRTAALAELVPFSFAAWVMSSGVIRIAGSISLKSEGRGQWRWILAFGMSETALGFILLFSPLLSSVIVGYSIAAMLIAHGLNDIIISFCLNKMGDHLLQ